MNSTNEKKRNTNHDDDIWFDDDADYVFVYDEPCFCLHTIFDLDLNQVVPHYTKDEGRINNPNLIQYRRPTYMKANKKSRIDDTYLHAVSNLFK